MEDLFFAEAELWVDFNDPGWPDEVTAIARHARTDVPLAAGQTVTVGDDEGSWARAVLNEAPDERGVFTLRVLPGSFQPSPSFVEELCRKYDQDEAYRRRIDPQLD
jgi:hypothetical protein